MQHQSPPALSLDFCGLSGMFSAEATKMKSERREEAAGDLVQLVELIIDRTQIIEVLD